MKTSILDILCEQTHCTPSQPNKKPRRYRWGKTVYEAVLRNLDPYYGTPYQQQG